MPKPAIIALKSPQTPSICFPQTYLQHATGREIPPIVPCMFIVQIEKNQQGRFVMYIKRIKIENIRCYEDIEFNLGSDKNKPAHLLLLGDNGVGKTSLLRSIAMGLCDEGGAAGLLKELYGEFRKDDTKDAWISIFLVDYQGKEHALITKISGETKGPERVRQKYFSEKHLKQKDIYFKKNFRSKGDDPITKFNWEQLFVSGYGANRSASGTEDYYEYDVSDAVYTLFKYTQSLQNPELAIYRLITSYNEEIVKKLKYYSSKKKLTKIQKEKYHLLLSDISKSLNFSKEIDPELHGEVLYSYSMTEIQKWIFSLLKNMLDLDKSDEIKLTSEGLTIKTKDKWSKNVPIDSLGDGYKSTITWILDFISWASTKSKVKISDIKNNNLRGIVIIDEIEQHLHPKWQKNIISKLTSCFPNIQFVFTSHSPLVTLDVGREREALHNIYHLEYVNNPEKRIVKTKLETDVSGFDLTDILASKAFDYVTSYEESIESALREASKFADTKNLNKKEQQQYQTMVENLKDIIFPVGGQTPIEKDSYKALLSEIDDLKVKVRNKKH